jgi:hypothetical protein
MPTCPLGHFRFYSALLLRIRKGGEVRLYMGSIGLGTGKSMGALRVRLAW